MNLNPISGDEFADNNGRAGSPVMRSPQALADEAAQLAHNGSALVRQRAQQLQERAAQARETAADYIQREPLKAVLLAAAGGAVLMWLRSLLSRRGPR